MLLTRFPTVLAGRFKAIVDRSRAPSESAARRRSLGPYTLVRKLGEGGMGEVYLAEHRSLGRRCAVKLIRNEFADDATMVARFESEARAMARLTHPNTVTVFDRGVSDDGACYYVMEFLPGMSLEEIVGRYGPLPPERVVYLLRQVCSALAEAHACGLVHRDVKPGNIFASERGGLYDVAKLLDFGLVKPAAPHDDQPGVTLDGAFVGSPLYAPPELLDGGGELDARGDIYSLGATAYHLLTGRPVFSGGNPVKLIVAHATQSPPAPDELRPGVPTALAKIVMRCLQKSPADRFQTAGELEAELSQCPLENPWTPERAKDWWTTECGRPAQARSDADPAATQAQP